MSRRSVRRLACFLLLLSGSLAGASGQSRPGAGTTAKSAAPRRTALPARPRAVLKGHTDQVDALAFSPDGKFLVSGAWDGTVRRWDVATGRELARYKMIGDDPHLDAVAVSPDGRTVAAGANDGGVQSWDVASSKPLETLGRGQVMDLAYLPDGATLVEAADDVMRLWDAATGEERSTIEASTLVHTLAASPDGRLLAWGAFFKDRPNEVAIFDVAAHEPAVRLANADIQAYRVAFSPDGRTLAACGQRETNRRIEGVSVEAYHSFSVIKLWDATTGKLQREYDAERDGGGGRTLLSLSYSPDGSLLALGTSDATVEIWDVATLRRRGELKGHTDFVDDVRFSPDGRTLASAGRDRTIRLWDVATAPAPRPAAGASSASGPGEVRRFEGHGGAVAGVAVSRDGRIALSGGEDGDLRAWEVASGKLLHRLKGHSGPITGLAFALGGTRAVTCGADRSVRVWDLDAGRELRRLDGHARAPACLAVAPDGRRAVVGGEDELILWDLEAGKPVLKFAGVGESIRAVAITPDGRLALTGGDAKAFRTWDLTTGRQVRRHEGHEEAVVSIAAAPDVQMAATGSEDDSASLWNLQTGEESVNIAEEHDEGVTAVALARGGRLLTGSGDGKVRLWDGPRQKVLLKLEGHVGPVTSLAFGPDGRTALSAGADGTVRLWNLSRTGR